MTDGLWFFATLAIATVFGIIFMKMKIPTGAMIGAMISVAIFKLATGKAVFYEDIRQFIQIFAGAMVGSRMRREDILNIKKLILPIIILISSMLFINAASGYIIAKTTSLDITTALFATAPGGATDMAIISADMGANSAHVAIMQLLRLMIIIVILPPLFKRYSNKINLKPQTAQLCTGQANLINEKQPLIKNANICFIIMIIFSAAGGYLFNYIGVAAGFMVGAMIFSTAFSLINTKSVFPVSWKIILQIFSGAYIGMKFDKQTVAAIPELAIPILIMLAGFTLLVFFVSWILSKYAGMDKLTAIISSTPGGLQEMSLLSEDLKADTPKIALLQTARLICVVMFFPSLILFLSSIL